MKRKALGKGLSALLPEPEAAPAARGTQETGIDELDPNPHQPRGTPRAEGLEELAASIRHSGVVQPILVRPHGRRFQIIAGERRWRAARLAGLTRVPVMVREVPDEQLLEFALVENLQRENLSPLEEAHAFRRLQQDFELTQDEIATRVGRDRSTVANALRLLRLPAEVRELLAQGRLDAGHARALLSLSDPAALSALAEEAARAGLSVREVEKRVAATRAVPAVAPQARRADANTRAAEERLRAALGTRVEIRRRRRGGDIRLTFANESELNRLYEALIRAGRSRP